MLFQFLHYSFFLIVIKYTAFKDNASQENLYSKFFTGIVDEEVPRGQEDDKEEE